MNFGDRFPDGESEEGILVYLMELRETLTAWDKAVTADLKKIRADIDRILTIITGGE